MFRGKFSLTKRNSFQKKSVLISKFFINAFVFAFGIFCFFLSPFIVHAATVTFDNSAGTGTWEGPTNWDTNTVPTSADTVIIGTTVAVTATSTIDFSTLQIGNGTLTASLTLTGNIGTGGSITIKNAGTLTQNNAVQQTLSGTLTIEGGGTLKSGNNTTAQSYIVNFSAATISLIATGTITTDALGYDGGAAATTGSGPGAGVGNAIYGSGGAHAGNGGTGSAAGGASYCTLTDVATMGSGGGGGSGSAGGAGGGLIILTASGTATLNGTITADGAAGTANGGAGGAGGGIKITANVVSGSPTSLTATGGNAGSTLGPGSGGGGCIEVVYTTSNSLSATTTFASSAMTASGGTTGPDGGPGVFYIKQVGADGDMVIKNGTLDTSGATTDITSPASINNLYLNLASTTFSGVTVNTSFTFSTAALRVAAGNSFTLDPSITSFTHTGTTSSFYLLGTLNATGLSNFTSTTVIVPTGTWNNASTFTSNADTVITLLSGAHISNTFTSLNSAGTFALSKGVATTTNMTISGGTMTLSNFTTTTPLAVTTLTMTGGTLTHAANTTTQIHVVNVSATTLTMSSTSTISADSLGYSGGAAVTTGSGPGAGIGYSSSGSGGAHAGNGGIGDGAGGTGYCVYTDVETMGSGGGGGTGKAGGDGGGLIILNISGTATIAGTITADGSAGASNSGGGGAGGGIKITADVITGSPTSLTATGGSAGSTLGSGAGGGGCIGITYTTSNSLSATTTFASAAMTASGGTSGNDGGPGVIFVKQSAASYGDMVIKNTSLDASGATTDITSPTTINNLYLNLASTTFSGVTVNTSFTFSTAALRVASGNSFTLDPSITSFTHTGTTSSFYILGTLNATGLSNFTSTTLTIPSNGTWNNASTFTSNADTVISLHSTSQISNTFTSLNSAGTFALPRGVATTTNMTVSGGTMTLSNFTTTSPLSVGTFTMTGGTLTHAANTTTQTHVVNVSATTITMSSTSTISADSLGYSAGATGLVGNGPGAGGAGPGGLGGGGAHAGNGGNGSVGVGGSGYCVYTDVETMGSGGGGGNSAAGGDGGGLIILNASGTATLAGTLTADGSTGGTWGGGGAGGGIKITADTIAGIPTGITATGGVGSGSTNGNGGGGCVQITYTTANSLSASVLYNSATTTVGGAGTGVDGGSGVIFVKQSAADIGDMVIKNAGLEAAGASTDITSPTTIDNLYISYASTTFSGVTVSSSMTFTSGTVRVASGNTFTIGSSITSLTKTGTVTIPAFYILGTLNSTGLTSLASTTLTLINGATWNNATSLTSNADTSITFNSGSRASNTFSSFSSAGTFNVSSGTAAFTNLTVTAGTVTLSNFTTSTALPVSGTFSVTGGTITHTANTSTQTHVVNIAAGTITIGASGTVSANGKGYSGGASSSGSGQGPGGGTGNATAGGGGGYGGIGSTGTGGGAGGAAYCTVTSVQNIGSGGGARTTGVGGAGGGLIILDAVGTVTVNGTISATGSNGSATSGGGGSGGGIKIRGAVVAGTPASLTVIGGNGNTNGGGGGGGCVQVAYTTSNSIASATVTKGTGGAGGANGLFGSGTSGVTASSISGATTEAGGTATFTVVLSSAPSATVEIPVSSSDTTEGTVNTSTLSFSTTDWNIARTVTVTGVDDSVDDGNISYAITLGAASSTDGNYDGLNPDDVSVSNTDNDTAGVTITESGGTTDITEGGATDTYTIVLGSQPTGSVYVSIAPDADASVSTSSIFFTTSNWNVAQTVTVTAVDDAFVEGAHTATITHSVTSTDTGYNAIATNSVVANVTDNDAATPAGVTITQSGGTTDITEAGATDSYTIVLDALPTGSVFVNIAADAQSTVSTSSIIFTTGNWNVAQTITVTAVNDNYAENLHSSVISHSATSTDNNYNAIGIASVTATVTDNDTAGVTVTESGGTTDITEAGATDTYTLVLTSAPTGTVNIALAPDAQCTVSTSSVSFTSGNWNSAVTVTASAVNDSIAEGAHSCVITHTATSTNANYDAIAVATVTANVTDNDNAGFTVSAISGNTSEAGGSATFTVVLNSEPTGIVTTTVHSSDTSEGTIATSTLVFDVASWNLPRTVTVTGVDDILVDGDIAYSIILDTATSSDPNYDGVNPADVAVTNTDNDIAGVTITESAGTTDITEGGATDTYTIVLNTEPGGDVAVSITADAQSTVSTSSIVFTNVNWNVAQTITVTAVDDAVAEGVHSSTISHSATSTDPGYDAVAIASVTANVTDNDSAGFTVSVISGDTTEAGATATFTVVLNTAPTGIVTTTLQSSDTTEGSVNTTTLVFDAASWNLPRTVTVTGVNDFLDDGDIAYSIILDTATSTDVNYSGVNPADVNVTNIDNDTAGITLTESAGTTNITEGGATDSYTIVLNSMPTGDVAVNLSPDAQSTLSTSSIFFTALNWNVEQTITITAVDDAVSEGDHMSTITHSVTSTDLGYDAMLLADVVANITDNDSAGFSVSIISGDTTEAGATSTFTVVLNTQPTGIVTTTVHSSDTSEGTIATSTLVFHTNDWNIPRTVVVTGVNDAIDDGNIGYSIILDTATSTDLAYSALNPTDVDVVNIDDDTAGITLTESAASTDVTEGGATDTYTLVLDSEPTANVAVSISPDAQSTLSTSSIVFTALNWNVAQTITVTAVNDALAEGGHTSTITHTVTSTDIGYDAFVVPNVLANITDNDSVGVTLSAISGNTSEAGGTATFTVVLDSQPTATVTTSIQSSDTTEGTIATSTLVFHTNDWNIPRTITVTGVDDILVDGDIAYSIILDPAESLDGNYNGFMPGFVAVTNTDNDIAGVTLIESAGTTDVTEGGATDTYTIVLNTEPSGNVAVSISADAQSTVSTSSIVFTALNWNVAQTITVTAVNDAVAEGGHTTTITHTVTSTDNGYDAAIVPNVVANITDNDTAGFDISGISGETHEDGTSATFTVVLTSQPTGTVTTTVHSTDSSEGITNTSTLVFTALDWNIVRTVTVTGINDDVDDGNQAYTIILDTVTSSDPGYDGMNPNDVDMLVNIDDDTAGVTVTESAGTTDITEGGVEDSYTIVLNSEPTGDVAISITPDAQSTVSTSSILFNTTNWNIAQTVTATALDDGLVEGPHMGTITHSVTSTDPGYDAMLVADVVANITDNAGGSFIVSLISASTTEAGGTATFTVVLSALPTGIVTTTVHSSDTTEGSINTSTLVFDVTDWNLPRTVTVTGVDDAFVDGNIDYSIILDTATSTDINYDGRNPADVSVTNIDNDSVGVTVTQSAGTTDITEGGASDSYTLVLNSQPTGDVAVSIAPDAQSTVSTSSIVFTALNWNVAQTITLTAVNDAIAEGDHTSTITHTATSTDLGYDGIAIDSIIANVTDNDAAGFTVSLISGDTSEDAGTATFTVVLDSPPSGRVTTTLHSSDTTEGTINTSTLVFDVDSWNLPRTVTVTGVDDELVDGNIAYSIILDTASSTDVHYAGLNPADVSVTNTDNDTVGITLVESAGTTDITEGGAADSYTVVLNSEPTANVTVSISSDAQSTLSTSSILFTTTTWNIARTISVTAVNDHRAEGPHTSSIFHTVTSTDLAYDGLAIPDVVANVTDNDNVGITLTESGGTTNSTEGAATDSYTLVLTSEPSSTVAITLTPDTQVSISTSSISFSSSTWNIPQTITVTAIDDSITEGGHVGIISHAVSSDDTAYNAVIIADLTTNITDNDSNSVVLTESGGTTNITEGGATDSYTLVLSSEPLSSVFVSIAPDAQSTLSTSSIQFTTTTWNIPQTITVTAVNDIIAEGAHDSTLTHSVTSTDIGYDAIVVANITAHITDNDTAGVTLAQSAGTTNIAEGGATDSYTVVLTSQPSSDVTITVTPDAQSTVSTSSIIFTALNWNVAQTVTLTAEDDVDVEGPHTSVITHSADSLDAVYNAIVIADLTANVIDNDTPGVTITESLGTTDITEGGIEDSYTIVLNALPLADVTIDITPDAASTVSTSSLVFNVANWNIPRVVTTTAVDDAVSQGLHISTITHSVSSLDINYDLIATSDVVANVTDNDTAGITVSAISGNTSEAGATSTYTVVLDSEPRDDVFIPVSSSDASEATVDQLLLTFTSLNWNIPQTITVTGVDDLIADGPMNYSLVNALASSTDDNYDGRNPADVDAINTDNDVAGISLTQSGGVTNVTEGGATDSYTLVLDSEPVNDVTITISPDAQSTVSTSSIVFTAANWNVAQTITVSAFNDDIVEDPHDSIISAAATSLDASYNGIVIADVTAHITDNDTAGFTVSLISGDTSEAGSTATFSVVLNSEPTGIVTTSLSSSDLTEGTVSTSTLLFSPADWDMPRVVTVSGVNDHFDDGDIDFTIVLDAAVSGDANYNGLNPDDVSVTNIDDDGVGVNIVESAGSTDISEAGSTDSYSFVLGSTPTADVVITLASDDQSTISTTSITFTPDNWNISQEVTISAVDDAVDEGAHTSTLTASAASGDISYNGIAIVDITVHISDNDGVIDPVKVGGGGGAITIPSIPIIPRVENLEQSEKSIIFASKDTEILNFSSSSHRVIRVSATVEDAVLVIESDPIVVRLKKDIPQILDTDKNGIPDLRVVYDGLVGKNPKFTFTELQELLAVFINNGAKQTFSHRVHLQFNVVNAAFVALSNNPDFRDATFQTFTTNSVWALPFGDGEKTVYVRFRSKSGGVFDSSASIRLVHSMTACSLNLGRPYKSPDSSAVYYITPPYNKDGQPIEGPCTKRPFKSPASFFSYFGSWGDVQIVSKSELANIADDALGFMPRGPRYAPQNGTLMKVVSDPKVYLLIDGKKHIINNEEVFNSLGFHWDEVEDVAAELLDTFSVGDTIVKNQAPLLSVIQYPDSPRLYFLEKSPSDDSVIVKRYITSESAWKSLKYRIDRVIRLSASSVYQDGNPIGQEAPVSVESQSPSQNFVFTHSLALNDTGEEVEALQKILAANGYFNHEVTGLYGPVTVEAVKAFQVAHGLEALGIVGPGTRSLLNSL